VNCDRIARAYRWLEYAAFGRELERRRFRFLAEVAGAQRALLLGDGDGRFLSKLVEQNRTMTADTVDASARMLELARARAGSDRATYIHGDALSVALAPAEYDLIVTHFFLDCLDACQMEALISRAAAAAKPGALWLVSEFREPRWARLYLRGLYLFFRLTTGLKTQRLVDHRPVLARHGFRVVKEETSRAGLLASELWKLE
jgi:ubiquinone/menaquinone biosynthesis C-methylase UbiE